MRKEPKPNYDIMFKSAVSMLQTTYTDFVNTQRAIFNFEHGGHFNSEGYFCITVPNEEWYMENLAKKEQYLAEQLEYYMREVERLRKLKDNERV